MIKHYKLFLLSILLLISSSTLSQNVLSCRGLQDKINVLIDNCDPNLNIGLIIKDLNKNQVLVERNSDRYFNFASNLKILTLASFVEKYGIDYKFYSKIYRSQNDLYIDIGDNPSFSTIDLEDLLIEIKSKNIGNVKGNIFILNPRFNFDPVNPFKSVQDAGYCYGAPVTRLHINRNCYNIVAQPGRIGSKVKIDVAIPESYQIINKSTTIRDNAGKARIERSVDKDKIYVAGTLNKSSNPLFIGAAIDNHFLHFSLILKSLLKKHGILLHGKIQETYSIPQMAKAIATKITPIEVVGKNMISKSDNFISDYLFLKLVNNSKRDEWHEAGEEFSKLLASQFHSDFLNVKIVDGSGLSRQSLLTVRHLSDLLTILKGRSYYQTFLKMLTNHLEDGTLKGRMQDLCNANLYAKTGSMEGITSLSGYLTCCENVNLSFVIVINNYYGDRKKYKDLEDNIVKLLADEYCKK